MRFIDDDVTPVELLQRILFLDDHFVRRDAHVKATRNQILCLLRFAFFAVTVEFERANDRTPTLEFVHPVTKRGFRDNHHVRSSDTAVLV